MCCSHNCHSLGYEDVIWCQVIKAASEGVAQEYMCLPIHYMQAWKSHRLSGRELDGEREKEGTREGEGACEAKLLFLKLHTLQSKAGVMDVQGSVGF